MSRDTPLTVRLSHPEYRADIDGLRALAVLSVLGFHAFPNRMPGGFIGVDIFFVISGFLISTIIFGNLAQGTFSYKDFYERRIKRIFPALILVLVACFGLGWHLLLTDEYRLLGSHTLAGNAFVSNFLLWNESNYFNAETDTKPLLHLWSLAIEEQFYIFWPLLMGIVWKSKRHFLTITIVIALLSFAINLYCVAEHPAAAFYSPLSRFWELILGGLLAYFALHQPALLTRHSHAQSALGFLLLASGLLLINKESAFPGAWALLPTLGAVCIISAGKDAYLNKALLSNKLAVWFGLISYPLYLWHWPLLSLALLANNGAPLSGSARAGLMLLAMVLAWLTFKLLETPLKKRPSGGYLLGGFALTGVLALVLMLNHGFPQRGVNQNQGKVFLSQYRQLRQTGLADYYQEKCDFYDWRSGGKKNAISPECTESGGKKTVYLLWGDSHAQALSWGLRQNLPANIKLAEITASGCKPKMQHDKNNGANRAACRASIDHAMAFIKQQHPAKVLVAQINAHKQTDWEAMSQFVRANQGQLVVLGPLPQWHPSLPIIMAKNRAINLANAPEYSGDGLDLPILETDAQLKADYANTSFRYISIIDQLCQKQQCKAQLKTSEKFKLSTFDYGHLTPAGSDYVVKRIVQQIGLPD